MGAELGTGTEQELKCWTEKVRQYSETVPLRNINDDEFFFKESHFQLLTSGFSVGEIGEIDLLQKEKRLFSGELLTMITKVQIYDFVLMCTKFCKQNIVKFWKNKVGESGVQCDKTKI